MQRVSSGNPRLDEILRGGFPRNAIHLVMGLPGTGKTLLAEQLAFANGSARRPVLYLTTLSEPMPKLVAYLQELEFTDVERVGREVVFDSLFETLSQDPTRLVEECTQLIERWRPQVMIIDSFKAISELIAEPRAWRKCVFELAALAGAYDMTSFWVGEYEAEAVGRMPEFAIADGIVALQREQAGSRDDRFLRVVKLRGSSFLSGNHAFVLSRSGLNVFPRLVGPGTSARPVVPVERLKTGISGLDGMIEAGWLRGSSTLVAGPAGSGKTTLGLHFLRQGVEESEPGLLVGFQESPLQLRRLMASLGWNADELVGPDKLDVFYTSPVELHMDSIVHEVFRRIEKNGVRRVVIDALADLASAAGDKRRFHDYVYALFQELAVRQVTSLANLESLPGAPAAAPAGGADVSNMSDNILSLGMELDKELTRTIRVIKSRASAHDGARHVLRIWSHGIEVD